MFAKHTHLLINPKSLNLRGLRIIIYLFASIRLSINSEVIVSNEPNWFRISVKMPLEAGDDLEQLEWITDAFTDTAPHPRYTFEVSALISTKS